MNYDEFDKRIADAAPDVRLGEGERALIKITIVQYMRTHPMSERIGFWHARAAFQYLKMTRWPIPSAVLATFLIAGSAGVSFAAESSLPGNALYSIKISVNERIQGAFQFTPEAEATWATDLASRRLEEAEELAGENALNQTTRISVEENFNTEVQNARSKIAHVDTSGNATAAAQLSSNFEAALKAHGRILATIAEANASSSPDQQLQIQALRELVGTHQDDVMAERTQAESKIGGDAKADSEAAAKSSFVDVSKKIFDAEELIAKAKTQGGAGDAEFRLAAASSTLAIGKAKIDAKDFGNAFRIIQSAGRAAEEARLVLKARRSLHLDIDVDEAATNTDSDFMEGELDNEDTASTTIDSGMPPHSGGASTSGDDKGHDENDSSSEDSGPPLNSSGSGTTNLNVQTSAGSVQGEADNEFQFNLNQWKRSGTI